MTAVNLEKNIFFLIRELWRYLSKKRKNNLKVLILTMIFSSLSEMFNLALIVPFLGILSNPEATMELSFIRNLVNLFGIYNTNQFLIFITILFAIASISSGVIRIINLWLTVNISALVAADISKAAYKRTIYQNYDVHISRNSSNLIASMSKEVDKILSYILNPILQALSSFFIAFGILITLFFINWYIAFVTFFSITFVYIIANYFNRGLLINLGIKYVQLQGRYIQNIQEGIGSIKDILLSSLQPFYVNIFSKTVYPLRKIDAKTMFIGYYPKLMIEPIGLVIISLLGLFLVRNNQINNVIPILGALAFGSIRLLPLAQRIYEGFAMPQNGKASLVSILKLLKQPINKDNYFKNTNNFVFNKSLILRNICFNYSSNKRNIISNLNMEIKKGERIGIIGTTGSGKSTTIDLIMGLLKPVSGSIYIDGKDLYSKKNNNLLYYWRSNIVHVPQSIYLSDSTIAQNIALGIPKEDINYENIEKAVRVSQLSNFIEDLPNGYDTPVGENGVMLSGGQVQRIGIARAIYRKIKLLILDEATSALDINTEQKILKSINSINKGITVIMISHRKKSLIYCDRILEIKDKNCFEIDYQKYFINN